MPKQYGPQQSLCDKVHADKYRAPGESFREAMSRIASALCESDDEFHTFRDILLDMRFLPGGRIQTAVGSTKAVTPYNCYVSGTIEDTFTEGGGSIMGRAHQAAATMRMGGGIGYDFSTLRPRGALIKKLSSHSSGPLPFMEIFNAICRATNSSGARRGAQMGVLRIDHPDIEEFIRAKQNKTELTGFNISVAVIDEFMRAVEHDMDFALRFGGTVFRRVSAKTLWNQLMRSTYDWAEPGILFIDRINEMNNLYYCEKIAATNPCGEQPLPPYGACLLGSFNLVRYLTRDGTTGPWGFDLEQLFLDVPFVVRAMDRIIDVARYPLFEQEQEAQQKRRMGLGVTGLANTIEAMGYPYGSNNFLIEMSRILSSLRDATYRASAHLARSRGAFATYKEEQYLNGRFIRTLSDETRDLIRENGIRNSHLLSIAPTGTISLTADNVSSGIEPVFADRVSRTIIEADGPKTYEIEDYGVHYLSIHGRTSEEVTIAEHLAVLACAQKYVDSAVSKTCNVPQDVAWDTFQEIYMTAWQTGCKGCTTYRKGGLREGILAPVAPEEPAASCEIDPLSGRRSCE